jgi:hypothetical protein
LGDVAPPIKLEQKDLIFSEHFTTKSGAFRGAGLFAITVLLTAAQLPAATKIHE